MLMVERAVMDRMVSFREFSQGIQEGTATKPMLLICVNKASNTRDAIAKSQVFAVNILRKNQSEVAKHFASSRPDKFGGVSVSYEALGVPLLGDVLATLERFGSATGERVSLLRSCSISLCNPWVFAILLSVGRN